jgi:hypothetical protein
MTPLSVITMNSLLIARNLRTDHPTQLEFLDRNATSLRL